VIDHTSYAPIAGATVQVGTAMKTTDSKGVATFSGVTAAQTVTVKADTYRSVVWVDANGQLPIGIEVPATATTMLVPKRSVFGADATYRLTAIAQTASGDMGAQSIVVRHGLTSTSLPAGTWLVPPTGVTVTRTSAAHDAVTGAKAHSVDYVDSSGTTLLEITVFDDKAKTVDVPALVALPSSGTLTAKVNGIAADFDVTDFSLDTDRDKLTGISAQPATIN